MQIYRFQVNIERFGENNSTNQITYNHVEAMPNVYHKLNMNNSTTLRLHQHQASNHRTFQSRLEKSM